MRLKVYALTTVVLGFVSVSGPTAALDLARGYIMNENGDKCWYRQNIVQADNYFHSKITANTRHLTFDHPACMEETDINKTQINNIVTRGYGRSDVIYAVHAEEMYPKSELQERGYCIKAKNYPIPAVAVDYVIETGNIIGVKHAMSFGCKN